MKDLHPLYGLKIWRIALTVNLAVLVIAGSITLGLRQSRRDACLVYKPTRGTAATVYDLRTGLMGGGLSNRVPVSSQTQSDEINDSDPAPLFAVARPAPNQPYVARLTVPRAIQAGVDYTLAIQTTRDPSPITVQQHGVSHIAWTPDGDVIYVGREADNYIAKVDTLTRKKYVIPWEKDWSSVALSPDSQYLAVIIHTPDKPQDSKITVLSTAQLFGEDSDFQPITHKIPTSGFIRWSPNSRHFAVFYFTHRGGGGGRKATIEDSIVPISLFSIDGKSFHDIPPLVLRGTQLGGLFLPARWSPDGRYLLFLQPDTDINAIHLAAFDTTTETVKLLRENVVGSLYFSFENMPFYDYDTPEQERIIVVYRVKNHLRAELMDTSGKVKRVLLNNADSIEEPLWLRDGKTAVIRWSQGKGSERYAQLTVAFADSRPVKRFGERYQEIFDFQRLSGTTAMGHRLNAFIYTVHYKDCYPWCNRYGIHILDLDTLIEHRLEDNLTQIFKLEHDSNTIRFWWDQYSTYGYSSYTVDGHLLQHLRIAQPIDRAGEIYYSGDRRFTAIVGAKDIYMFAQLLDVDGHTKAIVPTGPSEPNEIAWSGDGKLVAIAHDGVVEIFDTDSGKKIMVESIYWRGRGMFFSPCKELVGR